jgi:hypothetical protein
MEYCIYCGEEIEGSAFMRDGVIFCSEECADLYEEESALEDCEDDMDEEEEFEDDEW